ncbi:hypothetical protein ROZALSC1DRAFT_26293, partial [Rozella allomycis CSF55]
MNQNDDQVIEAYRRVREANEVFRDRLHKRRVEVFHSIVTDLAKPQNNGAFMRMVRSVKKRKTKDHCQLDTRKMNDHIQFYKSTFGSEPMGLYQDERDIVNGSEDENLFLNDDNVLLSDNVNLSYINENNLLEKFPDLDGPSSSYSTSRQSKKISEISNLPAPDSPLLNSSNSSDLDE